MTDTCEGCGFAAADYTHLDLLGTLRSLAPMWRTMTEGVPPETLAARSTPDSRSAIDHAADSRDLLDAMASSVERALDAEPGTSEAAAPQPATLASLIAEIDRSVARVVARAGRMDGEDWARTIPIADEPRDIAWVVTQAVHDTTHQLRAVGRGLHALGAGAPRQRGSLVQINASDGGVPKAALPAATIDRRGVVGDRQAERRHHGRPLQALSLWSQEVIDGLRAQGHGVYAGAAGENLTIAGVDWTTIRPGVRLSIGEVLAEISAFATPCTKNAQWFTDGNFRRIDHQLHPGASRAYAWVLQGGTVAAGDDVVVEP